MNEFTKQVIDVLLKVPQGKVVTYGQVAAMAGNHRGARQVVRILHTQTRKHNLPWHRVINSKGKIAINDLEGAELQQLKLEAEGVIFDENGKINLKKFQWMGLV